MTALWVGVPRPPSIAKISSCRTSWLVTLEVLLGL